VFEPEKKGKGLMGKRVFRSAIERPHQREPLDEGRRKQRAVGLDERGRNFNRRGGNLLFASWRDRGHLIMSGTVRVEGKERNAVREGNLVPVSKGKKCRQRFYWGKRGRLANLCGQTGGKVRKGGEACRGSVKIEKSEDGEKASLAFDAAAPKRE